MKLRRSWAILLLSSLAGVASGACGAATEQIAKVAESIGPIDDGAHKLLDLALRACEMSTSESEIALCQRQVNEAAEPMIQALLGVRAVWCSVQPEDCK